MMTSTNGAPSRGRTRKFWLLGLGIIVFAALYSGAWFFGADRLKNLVRARLSDSSVSVACTGLQVKGYPFRIGVFCDAIGVDDKRTGTSASFGALRSAAQVYNPGHAIVELDGPAVVRVSPDIVLTADWNLLHASGVAGMQGLDRASIAYDALKGSFTAGIRDMNLGFTVRHGEIHTRTNGTALDAALSMDEVELTVSETRVPKVNVTADVTIADAADWLKNGVPDNAPRDTRGDLRTFSLDFGNGNTATLSGSYEINADGLLSGKFELEVKGIDTVRDIVAEAFPEFADTATSVADTIRALSGGRSDARVKLRAKDGVISLGIIPLASIGPL